MRRRRDLAAGRPGAPLTAPWTREQIEAWVACRDEASLALRGAHPAWCWDYIERARRTLVRLCPEAPDYEALARRLRAWITVDCARRATDEEIRARLEGRIAALWQPSLAPRRAAEEGRRGA